MRPGSFAYSFLSEEYTFKIGLKTLYWIVYEKNFIDFFGANIFLLEHSKRVFC